MVHRGAKSLYSVSNYTQLYALLKWKNVSQSFRSLTYKMKNQRKVKAHLLSHSTFY